MRKVIITTTRLITDEDWPVYLQHLAETAPKGFDRSSFAQVGVTESREWGDIREKGRVHTMYRWEYTQEMRL